MNTRSVEEILTTALSQFDNMDEETLRILVDSDTDTNLIGLLGLRLDEIPLLRCMLTNKPKVSKNTLNKLVHRVGDDLSCMFKLNYNELYILSCYDPAFLAREWRLSKQLVYELQEKMELLAHDKLLDEEVEAVKHT